MISPFEKGGQGGFMKVVTFYSFKGGVGRSLALANIALLLATRGRRVLAADFDLEAPGLSMMSELVPNPHEVERGLFEYLLELLNYENPNLADYLIYPKIEGVDLAFLPAGNLKNGYDLSKLDFARLFEEGNTDLRSKDVNSERNPLSQFRREIEELGFTYALLDSRTGMTEIAATCTLGLADVVVMLSGLNDQNLQGTRWVLDMLEGRLSAEDIIVVFSPVPEAEEELKVERLQCAREIVGNRDVLLLPYHPRLALVEELFVKEWKETFLAQKYRQLASKISRRNPDDIEGIIEEEEQLEKLYAKVIRNPKDGAEMAYISAGEFIMGTSDAQIDSLLRQFPDWERSWFDRGKPQRRIYLDGYWIYKYEVTVAQYRKFCQETGRRMPSEPKWGWQDNHPVVNVTWYDAVAYCEWAGVQLPTEAQWEKAARGTDGRIWPWGNEWDANKCNNGITGPGKTTSVDSHPQGASPYGVMNMAGNVWEWCADWYDENYYVSAPERNPHGPVSGNRRVLRGGSWSSDVPNYLRAASRYRYNLENWSSVYGFRGVALRLPR
jgi:iron(II)-dependent oxidoreductase